MRSGHVRREKYINCAVLICSLTHKNCRYGRVWVSLSLSLSRFLPPPLIGTEVVLTYLVWGGGLKMLQTNPNYHRREYGHTSNKDQDLRNCKNVYVRSIQGKFSHIFVIPCSQGMQQIYTHNCSRTHSTWGRSAYSPLHPKQVWYNKLVASLPCGFVILHNNLCSC